MKVPRDLREVFGKAKITHPLHTDSLKEANERKWAVVTAIKARITEAQKALANSDPLVAEAMRHRLQINAGALGAAERLMVRTEELTEGQEVTDEVFAFLEVAKGISTPLDLQLDAFIAHKGSYRAKSEGDLRRVIGWLKDWLKARRIGTNLEAVDRKAAGAFIDSALLVGRSRKKATAYLAFLREYWKWLKQRGHVEDNPWLGQEIAPAPRQRPGMDPDGGKRPYTDKELVKLIYGPGSDYLGDLIRVAALSGMRLEEICQLRTRDCRDARFQVQFGKTDNARRQVPIHPDLLPIIEARLTGKAEDAYLFHELPEVPESRDTRSDPASKRFTRYRRDVGVDERPNDKAKSNVDFHSFRRWFIRKARDAMEVSGGAFNPWTLADVVGHDDEGVKDLLHLTMSHYPGQSSDAAKKACVEAVKLPNRPLGR